MPDIKEPVQLYTVDEAAALLKLSKSTLYQLCRRRLVPHRRNGVLIRFTAQDMRDIADAGYRPVVTR